MVEASGILGDGDAFALRERAPVKAVVATSRNVPLFAEKLCYVARQLTFEDSCVSVPHPLTNSLSRRDAVAEYASGLMSG